jgi:hypothetical protein
MLTCFESLWNMDIEDFRTKIIQTKVVTYLQSNLFGEVKECLIDFVH